MPLYSYQCLVEAGGCGQPFREYRPMHARQNVMCPNCTADGNETFTDADGHTRHKVEAQFTPPYITHDITHQDGGSGDSIPMPTYGADVRIRSKRELAGLREKAREDYHAETGIDPGEIGHIDSRKEHKVTSPFDDNKTHEEAYAEIAKTLTGVPKTLGEVK